MGVARASLWLLALVALSAALLTLQPRSAAFAAHCSGTSYHPDPTTVTVDAVPIVAESTTDGYFALYVKHDVDGTEVELPVLVKRGEAGTTTLAENVEALPAERYRVEKYLIADPADVDGDCIDDITELADPVGMNPVNPAPAVALNDGAVVISDRDTFEALAVSSRLKFIAFDVATDRPVLYFLNTKTHDNHISFLDAVGLDFDLDAYRGDISYDPTQVASDGSLGAYYYNSTLNKSYPLNVETRLYTILAASLPLIEKNISLYIPNQKLPTTRHVVPLLRESRIPLLFTEDVIPGGNFLALNPGEGYGRLQVLNPDDRPHPRDVVIYEALPNELPRVAGIISTVPQTPLSHVNLRAIQDGVPNAFVRDALDEPGIDGLIGSYVRYVVTDSGWDLRAATLAEVEAHYEESRPAHTQTPERDLAVTEITPLSEIGFGGSDAFGVKAANVAVLGKRGLPEGTVPDGFAIPFYFYDEFMKHNNFYERIETMLADPDFQSDFDVQDDMLDDLREDIEGADTPQWILAALATMNEGFPAGINRRYRSSTNNEDLPGFNGAGLYDSKSQKPDEDEDDGLDKSLKEVYASLWNFRAFTEREFHRIDHLAAAMGILVHPSYQDELANGVAVTFDPLSVNYDRYYVNTQLGEDLVTNPEAHSTPEELLLRKSGSLYVVLATSNLLDPGELLMSYTQLRRLRDHLTVIHDDFHGLYNPGPGDPFAMEIEFKITSEGVLAIKQARPWVFGGASTVVKPPVTPVSVGFGASSYTVAEGESVPVVVSLSADPERTLTIPLTPREQGGASSADHSGIPASVTFVSGVTSRMVDVSAAADGEADAGESVWIGFGALPAGVTVGGRPTTTIAITDSGAPPVEPPVTVILGGGGGGGGPSGPTPSDVDFEWNVTRDIEELDGDHGSPTGAWSDDTTLWLAENADGADDAVYAYDLATGERVEELEFELDDANLAPRGVWSDLRTIWISDSGKDKLFAHDLGSGERLPDSDLALHPDNDDPRGIWSDGSTMWVLDGRDDALFGYDLVSGELLAGYALHDDNGDPHGIWSDGVSAWVSDDGARRLFAYRLPSIAQEEAGEDEDLALERVRDEEFWKLPRVSNNSPRGLWSDGDVMYVADENDDKVYSYNMPDAIDARLASLTLSDVEIGKFSGSRAEYAGVAADGATATTVEAEGRQSGATVVVGPPDSDGGTDGHQATVDAGSEITVTVTSPDESRMRVYRVRIGGAAEQLAAPACLSGSIDVGFSLVISAAGSVGDLVSCAQGRDATAVYALHDGGYVPYILGAPEFVNRSFRELYADGLPSFTPLIAKSEGPPSPAPASDGVPEFGPECLRGEIAVGFSLVLYGGGTVDELKTCVESRDATAVYALHDGGYVPYILGAPEFVNRGFRELFLEGLAPVTPLIAKRD